MDRVVKREVVLVKKVRMDGTNTGSIDTFWDSIDALDLSPEQRKHFVEIMRKEVRT